MHHWAHSQKLGVRARQRRPFRAPPAMDQLTCTRFSGRVRPVLKHGPKSLTVWHVVLCLLEPANALKAPACTSAQATVYDLESGSRKGKSV